MPALRFALAQGLLALLFVTAALSAATQWAAAMLGHHPALGRPLIVLLGGPIYAPWSVLVWWVAFGTRAPLVFAKAGILAALGGLGAGFITMGGTARRAGHRDSLRTYGSARWADA